MPDLCLMKSHQTRIKTQKKKLFKSLVTFTLTSVGIPILYYGSEQLFAGGSDPHNREALWNNMDTTSEMYKFISTVN